MIKAKVPAENPEANLKSYDEIYRTFSWSEIEKHFSWHQTGQLNIVQEAIDRWADAPQNDSHVALIFEQNGEVHKFNYRDLKEKSCQWANLLVKYGFNKGDRLFIFLPPCPEIYFVMLACARMGVLFCPLFSTFGYDEVEIRLENASPRGIITHPDLVDRIPPDAKETLKYLFLIDGPLTHLFPKEIIIKDMPDQMSKAFDNTWLSGDTPLYMSYTSGSTGPPKGIVHGHQDMVGMLVTGKYVLDLRKDTVLWVDADPAWVTGTVYGAFVPWLCGATTLIQGDPFLASNWYWTLEKHQVAVWYTTPKTIRELMKAGENLPSRYDLQNLRHISTVGATLVPDLFYWVKQNLNLSPHDTWWMSETGIICIANFASMDIKPGAIGKPVPGIEAVIVDEEGQPLPPLSMGELALKARWPGLMGSVWKDEQRYQAYFRVPGLFLTGDIALQDEDGYFYHQGRNDDLLKVGGDKVIGPFEIERVLYMHPAVAEAAVISKGTEPGEGVSYLKAFIAVHQGITPSTRLTIEIKAFVKANLSSEIIVGEVEFLDKLPKTRTGKLLRRILRARELGLPSGDPRRMNDG